MTVELAAIDPGIALPPPEASATPPLGTGAPLGQEPKVWGLSIVQLHDRFWAARGVQVVRLGERSEIVEGAELFMLTDPRTLVTMRIREVVEKAIWVQPDLLIVRLKNMREEQYSETAVCDSQGAFVRYQRSYGGWDSRLARICFTRDPVLV